MPRRSPNQSFELFFTPKFPYYFLPGGLLVAVMGDALSEMAKSWLLQRGVEPEAYRLSLIFVSALIALVTLVAAAFSLGAIQQRLIAPSYRVVDRPMPVRARGLVAFASLSETDHLEAALKYHGQTLEKVWLLATNESLSVAEDLREKYALNSRAIEIVLLNDAFDMQSVREEVERLYLTRLGGMPETDVIADFTGGTKPMSLGMIFACLSSTRRLQYVMGKYEKGRVSALSPVEYGIDFSMVGVLSNSGESKMEPAA